MEVQGLSLVLLSSVDGGWTEEIGAYVSVALISSVKFLIAVIVALGNQDFGFWDIIISAGGGAILGSVVYTYFGTEIRKWVQRTFRRSKPMSITRRRFIVKVWRRWGLFGVAFLAPIISPMASIGIAVSFQEPPRRILLYMTVSILAWSVLLAAFREGVIAMLG
ncbi:MAG: hypothetical protein NW241_02620 [Bacteroidia bacterium]|nr:hypothetical protein [Bacteroidia bacterium]